VFDYPSIRDRLKELRDLRAEELKGATKGEADGTPTPLGRQSLSAAEPSKEDDGKIDAEAEKEGREAERVIQRYITLFVEPSTATEMKEALLASHFKDFYANPDLNHILIIYDRKQASESQTRPMTRIAPLKESRLRMILQATLEARMQATTAKPGTGLHIADADMWLLFDGSRTGHHHLFNNKLFIDTEQDDTPSLTKVLRLLRIEYLESSVAERRAYNWCGVASLKSNETITLVTARIVRLPQKQKKFFFWY